MLPKSIVPELASNDDELRRDVGRMYGRAGLLVVWMVSCEGSALPADLQWYGAADVRGFRHRFWSSIVPIDEGAVHHSRCGMNIKNAPARRKSRTMITWMWTRS